MLKDLSENIFWHWCMMRSTALSDQIRFDNNVHTEQMHTASLDTFFLLGIEIIKPFENIIYHILRQVVPNV
jgi:hypothetical protein